MTEATTTRSLADRAEILDVLALFCERVDEYDMDGVAAVFTEDCFTDYGPGRGGPVHGRAAVRARIARGQAEFRRTHHQLGQSRIRLRGDRASAVTYVTAWHEDWAGEVSSVRLRYLDEMVRTAEGWRIAERRAHAAGVEGLEQVAWVWVPRRRPPGHPAESSPTH